jgi:hypothetical protein
MFSSVSPLMRHVLVSAAFFAVLSDRVMPVLAISPATRRSLTTSPEGHAS